jgi:hypothetical protein
MSVWPSLPLEAWSDTHATLHRWMQIVGKMRLVQTSPVNHCWSVALYVTPRGLTTGPIPHGTRSFQIDFDFVEHQLRVAADDGRGAELPLQAQPVADFYRRLREDMRALGLEVAIDTRPNEVPDTIPLDTDTVHRSYDREYANRYWRILAQSSRVLDQFRARFIGKCSPVHFFWGAPDLAVTRFSGRPAPPHPGGIPNLPDRVVQEAYSHEVSSFGFWAGGGAVAYPAYYSYAYPEPAGFAAARVQPEAAFYSADLHEFVLPYDAVRTAASPDEALLAFAQSTYEAAADLGRWDRRALERDLR